MTFSLLKTFVTFFLMCSQLQRHEMNLILKILIEFDSFLLQNFVLMCCELQRHEINSIKVLFTNNVRIFFRQ